jgi:hypothetical protein
MLTAITSAVLGILELKLTTHHVIVPFIVYTTVLYFITIDNSVS